MKERGLGFKSILKGANLSFIVALISILIFGFIIKTASLNDSVIKSVNQFIKIISIFLGCMFFIKGKRGILKGGTVGLLFFILTHLFFALFNGSFIVDLASIIDLAFCIIIGAISGIISVNVSK